VRPSTSTDTQRGKIIVDKVTDPTGSSQSFDFTTDAGSPFSLTDTDTPWDSGWILPGTYYVSETVPVGWDLTSAVCDDGSPVGAIVVSPGETVTATFTDTQRGKIIVDKVTVPSGELQLFDFTLTGGPDSINQAFSLTDADTPHDSGWIKPGTYAAAEITVPPGWELVSATCSDGSPVTNIDISPGETVTVTFTNKKLLEFLKQFTGSGTLDPETYTIPEIIDPKTSQAFQIKTGPQIWWEVTYSVTNEDEEPHYYTLWDKWGGNLLILGGYPTEYIPGSAKKEAGDLTISTGESFTIDYAGYSTYLGLKKDISGNIVYAASHTGSSSDGAWMSLHTGDQQEETNPGKGNKNTKDGNSYDVDIRWNIGWLEPGETQTLTVYLAPGINPGGVLQFSSYKCYTVNTGPRVRAYETSDYADNMFLYSWSWTNQLTIIVEPESE